MFLLHTWSSVLDYKGTSLEEAVGYEQSLKNFFSLVLALIRERGDSRVVHGQSWSGREAALLDQCVSSCLAG